MQIREKKHRLPPESYRGMLEVAFTACTKNRMELFVDARLVDKCVFYDHIRRNEREIDKQIRYIIENPVRAGLVKHWKDFKFKGSTVFDLDEW